MTTAQLDSPVAEARPPVTAADRRKGRRTLLLLAFVCVLPVIASYLMFYVWPPQGRVNHGDLLTPAGLPATVLQGAGGQAPLQRSELEGKWTLLLVAPAACDEACGRALYVSRQARVAQAKEMDRVGRVWLLADAAEPDLALLETHEDLRLARADSAWLAALPAAAPGSVWMVDPLGNVMMHFADEVDTTTAARAMNKDLQRLLKYSALGRGGRE
ncbi:hypothetical protein [Parazoarcus communis]|uniref:hypothetical protein n=1 Tax=Parazoarcus communis TaxID=41977 RepID=UPI001F23EB15|nr:hypothetical protein [Parazoarcus communis]